MRSMINELTVNSTISEDIKLLLDAQIIFKEVGVKKLKSCNTSRIELDNEVHDDITVMFSYKRYETPFAGSRQYLIDTERNYMRSALNGFQQSEYYKPTTSAGGEKVTIEINGTDFLIGHYFRTNNLIVIYQTVFKASVTSDEYKARFIELCNKIAEGIKKVKPRKVSTKDFILNRLTETFITGVKNEKDRITTEVNEARIRLEQIVQETSTHTATINSFEEMKEQLEKQISSGKRALKKSIKEMSALPFVKEVHLDKNGISIDYEPIQVKYNKESVDVGRIRLRIKSGRVNIYNMDAVIYDGTTYDHPHVHNSGVCLGDHSANVGKLIGGMKLREIAIFFFTFLQSYNRRSPHIRFEIFQEIRKEYPVIDEPFPETGEERNYLYKIRENND